MNSKYMSKRQIKDHMSFVHFYQQSNLSLVNLQGKVIQCSVDQVRGSKVLLKTGLKDSIICFQSEFSLAAQTPSTPMVCSVGIEHLEQRHIGEPKLILPNTLNRMRKRKLVWAQLTTLWHSSHNRVRGFVMNSVNGGYAVAVAGYIAFLPRSLRIGKKMATNQWRLFSILNMNASLRNIVVKEIRATYQPSLHSKSLRKHSPTSQKRRSNVHISSRSANTMINNARVQKQHFNAKGRESPAHMRQRMKIANGR